MNKTNARKIAETITFEQLTKMFDNAKTNIKDWTEVSAVNKGMTKGTVWNILYKGLNPEIMNQPLALKNMIWEFGDHLEVSLKIKKLIKKNHHVNVTHQEPKF